MSLQLHLQDEPGKSPLAILVSACYHNGRKIQQCSPPVPHVSTPENDRFAVFCFPINRGTSEDGLAARLREVMLSTRSCAAPPPHFRQGWGEQWADFPFARETADEGIEPTSEVLSVPKPDWAFVLVELQKSSHLSIVAFAVVLPGAPAVEVELTEHEINPALPWVELFMLDNDFGISPRAAVQTDPGDPFVPFFDVVAQHVCELKRPAFYVLSDDEDARDIFGLRAERVGVASNGNCYVYLVDVTP